MINQTVPQISQVTVRLFENGEIIFISNTGEFMLGRTAEEQTKGTSSNTQLGHTDIDLSIYNAYEMGVSRHHASVYIGKDQVTLTDLGSTNGTRLNGNIISGFTPQRLNDKDIITLGKLKLQILIISK